MQVVENQKLLGGKIMHLSGEAAMVRLRNALSETRRQYSKSKEKSSSVEPPVTHIVPSNAGPNGRSDSVGRLPFLDHDSMSPLEDTGSSVASGSGLVNNSDGEMLGMENVFIVNKFLHGRCYGDNDSLNITDENQKLFAYDTIKKNSATFPLEVARKHMQPGPINGRVYDNMLHALLTILEKRSFWFISRVGTELYQNSCWNIVHVL